MDRFEGRIPEDGDTIFIHEIDALLREVYKAGMIYAGHPPEYPATPRKEKIVEFRMALQRIMMNMAVREMPRRVKTVSPGNRDIVKGWDDAIAIYFNHLRRAVTGDSPSSGKPL